MMKKLFFLFLIFFISLQLQAQVTVCTAPGQNPTTAFPVCGTSTFTQNSVPICGGKVVPAPGCNTYPLQDVNPFWYKFTCYQAGSLGFIITPLNLQDDYDWQLFDITGQDPNTVYTNISLTVACNWSGESGLTGASAAGTQLFVCEGTGKPLWSRMPTLIQGHEYILLVSHFTQSQSGYSLSFTGGTAVITDSIPPTFSYASATCGGEKIRVKLSKRVRCSSITSTGSDFIISPGNPVISSANAIGCSGNFDTDSVELTLANPLAQGNYTLKGKLGTDGNTVLDFCNNALSDTVKASFNVFPAQPTPMDSLEKVKCKPSSLRLVFSRPIACSSIAANGSDFIISGTYPVTIASATGNCGSNATTREVVLTLSQTLFQSGNFTITLVRGSDGNTLLDECTLETPVGSAISFSVKDTVNAQFSFVKAYGCIKDTIAFFHPVGNGVNSWKWNLDEGQTSLLQNPVGIYQQFTPKNISLVVSNGVCSDSSTQTIALTNYLKASFTSYDDNCPKEAVAFTSTAQGQITQHQWSFGDGGNSTDISPTHIYAQPQSTVSYIVRYTITDSIGCQSSVQKTIKIYSSCFLTVPTGFTPNGDGRNDYLYPLNAVKADQLDFRVYNRWGQLVFQTNNWKIGWDGRFRGTAQGTDVYVWFLRYVDRDTKQAREMKGTSILIR